MENIGTRKEQYFGISKQDSEDNSNRNSFFVHGVYYGTGLRKSTIVLFRQLKSMTFISFVHTSYLYLRLIFNFVPRASGQIDFV